MTKKFWIKIGTLLLIVSIASIVTAPAIAAEAQEVIEPCYTPSTQEEARCVPLMLEQQYWSKGECYQTEWHTLYNPETAAMMVDLAVASKEVEEGGDWEKTMQKYGYEQLYSTLDNEIYSGGTYHLCYKEIEDGIIDVPYPAINAIIGIQEVEYNGQTRYAVGIAFRGSVDGDDWFTDLRRSFSDEEGYHKGFSENAADFFYDLSPNVTFHVNGRAYSLTQIYQEMTKPNSQFCMLVMGHSLGGALTNVLVGRYLYAAGVHPSNLAGYAFATPLTAPASAVEEYPYDNIYNIINADDLVPVATLSGHQRFGVDLTYYPDDAFRQEHYGADYVEKHLGESHSFWQWEGFFFSGFAPHQIEKAYRYIVEIVSSEIDASTAENRSAYTSYSTNGYNDWGLADAVISPYTFGDLSGGLRMWGAFRFQGGVLRVQGDIYNSGGIFMNYEDDYLLAMSDLEISWGSRESADEHLTAGTVEVKGALTLDDGWFEYCYHATGTHRTVLSGSSIQSVAIYDEDVQFPNLYIRNSAIEFLTAVPSLCLAEDAAIGATTNLVVWDMDLNGHSFTQGGTLADAGSIHVTNLVMGGGTLKTRGDATIKNLDVMDGQMDIGGNLDLGCTLAFDAGQVLVGGDCYLPSTMIMNHEEDYLCVGGTLTVYARDFDKIPDDHLSAGTVEIKGDFRFDDCGVCTENGYRETGEHKTILSGTQPQTIWFQLGGGDNRFENLCIRNEQTSLYMLKDVRLGEDASLVVSGENREQRIKITGTLDLAGHTLTVDAADWTSSDYCGVDVSAVAFTEGGEMIVDGDMLLECGDLNGKLSVTGDLEVRDMFTFAGGEAMIGGDCLVSKSLVMQDESDYLFVGGDLTLYSHADVPKDHLTAGTVELKGNLNAYGSDKYYCYNASGTHKTVFSGTETQTVSMGAMYDHKVVQACLRNPNVEFASIYTLRLMEDGALTTPSKCSIHGNLDLNGYKLVTQGEWGLLKGGVTGGSLIQFAVDEGNEETPASITISAPTELVKDESICVLVTGYDENHQMVICEMMTFDSESAMDQTLSKEGWNGCTETQIFWLDGDFVPFYSTMSLDW